jgi:microsomal dipeptidase-like Zn-dependent dipeptidase
MIVDLHAHYPMHLLKPRQANTHAAVREPWAGSAWRGVLLEVLSRLFNYEGPGGAPAVTVELLRQGNVGAVLSVLFEPFDEMDLSEPYGAPPKSEYFTNLKQQIERVEEELAREHRLGRAVLVRNPQAMDDAMNAGEVAVIHCIEGAFAVGATEHEVARNVEELARTGVAYITLAHLFWRGVAQNAPAIPFVPDWLYKVAFPMRGSVGLTPLGEAVLRAMVEHHVLVDITHMNQKAIDHTFRLLGPSTPVIASHIACRLGSAEYNLTDDVIREVGRRGGVLGVIMCEHWACDGPPPTPKTFEESVDVVCTHIDRIVGVTGSDDHVAIGSDLDGYIKPALHHLEHEGRMKELEAALITKYGAERAKKFCSDNLLNLLRSYWRGDGGGSAQSPNRSRQ